MPSCQAWSIHHWARSSGPRRGWEKVSGRGSTAPSRSMVCRLRSRAALMSATSSLRGLPRSGHTAVGATARRGHGREAREPRGEGLETVGRFLEHLGGDLSRAHLGQREVMDDLADGPVRVACPPVRLRLTQALDLFEEPSAHGLEIAPERFDRRRQGHRYSSVECGTFSIIAHRTRTWYKVRCS